jgi:hypothetical protein
MRTVIGLVIGMSLLFGCDEEEPAPPKCGPDQMIRGAGCVPLGAPDPHDGPVYDEHKLAFAVETRDGGALSDEGMLRGVTLRIANDDKVSVAALYWESCASSQSVLNSIGSILWSCRQEERGAVVRELILQGQLHDGEVSGTFTLFVAHDPGSLYTSARWGGRFLSE